MPTSSQALILMTVDGSLPVVFGRQSYPGPTTCYPVSKLNFQDRCEYHDNRIKRVFRPIRAGSLPNLKLDLSTLPEILRIQGYRGSLSYDSPTKSLRWNIPDNSLHTLPEGRRQIFSDRPSYNYQQGEAYLEGQGHISDSVQWRLPDIRERSLTNFQSKHLPDEILYSADIDDSSTQTLTPPPKFRYWETARGPMRGMAPYGVKLAKDADDKPFPSKIVQTDNATDRVLAWQEKYLHQTPDGQMWDGDVPIKVPLEDYFSEKYGNRNAGPADAKSSPGVFSQTVDSKHLNYNQVAPEWKLENWKDIRPNSNREVYFADAKRHDKSTGNPFLPDIHIHEKAKSSYEQTSFQNTEETGSSAIHETDEKLYKRLVQLGFRRPKGVSFADTQVQRKPNMNTEVESMVKSQADENGNIREEQTEPKYRSNPLQDITHMQTNLPEQGITRAQENLPESKQAFAEEIAKTGLSTIDLERAKEKQQSLLEEVELKNNYKQWKRRKMTGIRMRKELPPSDPRAVCVTLPDNAISHEAMKELMESATGATVTWLQFDPLSVLAGDQEAKSRWIVRFKESTTCDLLLINGLKIQGSFVSVRRYDDVMKHEHEAYKLYSKMLEYQRRKSTEIEMKKRESQSLRPSRRNKTVQTQNANVIQKLLSH